MGAPEDAAADVLEGLRAAADPANVAGMARFGISVEGTLGVSMPLIRKLASAAKRSLGRDSAARHAAAALLWESGVHEARIAAALVDDPDLVDAAQMESWASELDSWDVCDQVCANLFDRSPLAWGKALEWAGRDEEFVKRAAFALMAALAWHDKAAPDRCFEPFLPVIVREASDDRNMVKKSVNWALRQIGKRDAPSNARAIAAAKGILERHGDSAAARWVARGALRELRSDAVRERLGLS